jgi:DNA polymerase-3 subunit delta'
VKRLEELRRAGAAGIALLLAGPEGVGKTAAAHAFARSWLGDGIERRVHPDFLVLSVPESRSEIPVEDVREARRLLHLRPARGPVRILHVEQAERLNDEGMNTLLKTLEEPPPYAIVLLECTHPSRLEPTLVSRCRLIRFAPLPAAAVERWLAEQHELPAARGKRIAALADGSLRRAQALRDGWDRLRPDLLPGPREDGGSVSREEARWMIRLWGRAASAALRRRAGVSPEQAAPWLAPGQLDELARLETDALVDLLDRVTVAQGLLRSNANPSLLIESIALAAAP